MSDQLSKACACKTPAACKAHGCCIESAAPVEVDEVDGYAAGMEARDMHAEARLLRTLARQLAEAKEGRLTLTQDYCDMRIRAEQAEAQLAEANRRLAAVEGLAQVGADVQALIDKATEGEWGNTYFIRRVCEAAALQPQERKRHD